MKTKKITQLLTLAFCAIAFAFVTSCEGPAGKDGVPGTAGTNGSDGTNGVDGNVTCLSCHNTDTKNLIAAQFNSSQHKAGDVAVAYAGGRGSCAECHSHEGYLEFALTGDVAADIANPGAWECSTCHALHTDFAADDYAFRLGGAVTLIADGTTVLDEGTNNTCINCHQSRRNVGYYDKYTTDTKDTVSFTNSEDVLFYEIAANVNYGPTGGVIAKITGLLDKDNKTYDSLVVEFDIPTTYAFISSTHAGPHHGPQANVFAGVGGAGTTTGVAFAAHGDGCVKCHMGPASGHSFWPKEDNCLVAGCHSSSKEPSLKTIADRIQVAGEALAAVNAVHEELLYGKHVAWHPIYASLLKDDFNAWWNFMLVLEDRSNSAHNPTYVDALLTEIETQLGI